MTKESIVFVSSAIQHPRHQKRIASLSTRFSVFVVYCTRRQYDRNVESFEHPEELCLCLGRIENNKYHRRIGLFFRLIRVLYQRQESMVYCTSMESAIAAMLTNKKFILELGDLHQFGYLKWIYRLIDSVLVRRLTLLVLTSPQFVSEYYGKYFGKYREKMLVIENKLPVTMRPQIEYYRSNFDFGLFDENRVRLGLIGSIRFRNKLEAIRDLIASNPNLELHIHGVGDTSIFENMDRCFCHGVYQNPADLQSIYGGIDVTIILYDNEDQNVQWALPNKLYESIAFLKPILCSDNCCLADVVTQNQLGVVSSSVDLSKSVGALIDNYHRYQTNLMKLSEDAYIDDEPKLVSCIPSLES